MTHDWTGVPNAVVGAAGYCERRGANVVVRPYREYVGLVSELASGSKVAPLWTADSESFRIDGDHIWFSDSVRVDVSGASDEDAVVLRLAGFFPVGNGWIWRRG